jgi:hypothetical protein
MSWFLEFAPDVMKRQGMFLPKEEVLKKTGFRSVYSLTEADAMDVRRRGNSKNLAQYAVFTDELVMDFDDGVDVHFKTAEKWLLDRDVSFSVFESGSKGLHIEAVCVPKYGRTIPQSQAKFVREVMGVMSDESIYRHGSLYRLLGTLHKKTGKPKKLLTSHLGDAMIDYAELGFIEMLDFSNVPGHDGVTRVLEHLLNRYAQPPDRGRRYQSLWSLVKNMKDAGLSESTSYELLKAVNNSWGTQAKEEAEVLRAMRETFRDVSSFDRSSL